MTLARNAQKGFLFKVARDISPTISGWLLVLFHFTSADGFRRVDHAFRRLSLPSRLLDAAFGDERSKRERRKHHLLVAQQRPDGLRGVKMAIIPRSSLCLRHTSLPFLPADVVRVVVRSSIVAFRSVRTSYARRPITRALTPAAPTCEPGGGRRNV